MHPVEPRADDHAAVSGEPAATAGSRSWTAERAMTQAAEDVQISRVVLLF